MPNAANHYATPPTNVCVCVCVADQSAEGAAAAVSEETVRSLAGGEPYDYRAAYGRHAGAGSLVTALRVGVASVGHVDVDYTYDAHLRLVGVAVSVGTQPHRGAGAGGGTQPHRGGAGGGTEPHRSGGGGGGGRAGPVLLPAHVLQYDAATGRLVAATPFNFERPHAHRRLIRHASVEVPYIIIIMQRLTRHVSK